mmetsp:Transcript_20488/g.58253  ORF Transcript_20488/g.58253 Transcript_20488/m.58253 type:complete len:855 (+) Transcript_20488:71-2635(+)
MTSNQPEAYDESDGDGNEESTDSATSTSRPTRVSTHAAGPLSSHEGKSVTRLDCSSDGSHAPSRRKESQKRKSERKVSNSVQQNLQRRRPKMAKQQQASSTRRLRRSQSLCMPSETAGSLSAGPDLAASIISSSSHSHGTVETAPSVTPDGLQQDLVASKPTFSTTRTPSMPKNRALSLTIGNSSTLSDSRTFIDVPKDRASAIASFESLASLGASSSSKPFLPDLVALERAFQDHHVEDIQEKLEELFRQRMHTNREFGVDDAGANDDDGHHDDVESNAIFFENAPTGWKTPFEVGAPREPMMNQREREAESRSLSPLLANSNLTDEQCAWAGIDDLLENRSVDDSYALSTSDVLPKSIARALKRSDSKGSFDAISLDTDADALSQAESTGNGDGDGDVGGNDPRTKTARQGTKFRDRRKGDKKFVANLQTISDESDHERSPKIATARTKANRTSHEAAGGGGRNSIARTNGTLFDVFQWSRGENVDESMIQKKMMKRMNPSPHGAKSKKKATFALDTTAHSLPSLDSFRDEDLLSKAEGLLHDTAGSNTASQPTSKAERKSADNHCHARHAAPMEGNGFDATGSQTMRQPSLSSQAPLHDSEADSAMSSGNVLSWSRNASHNQKLNVPGSSGERHHRDESDPHDGTKKQGSASSRQSSLHILANDGLKLDATVEEFIQQMQSKIGIPAIAADGSRLPASVNATQHQQQSYQSSANEDSGGGGSSPSPVSVILGEQAPSSIIEELPTLSALSSKKGKKKKLKKSKKEKHQAEQRNRKQQAAAMKSNGKKEPKASLGSIVKSFGGKLMSSSNGKKSTAVALGDESKYFPDDVVHDSFVESNRSLLFYGEEDGFG